MTQLFIVKIKSFSGLAESELDRHALEVCHSLGKIDYEMDEAKVDEILGKDAYCGGDIPDHLLEKLESTVSESSQPTYFWDNEESRASFLSFLDENSFDYELSEEEKKDWNESWRQSFQTIPVTETLKIVPSWEATRDCAEDIFIYPGMGFGTGNHETTFLCLKIYSEIKDSLGESFDCLDFGCGSGILGIAAIKQSKAVVDFVDIDKDALDNCVANLEYNNFQNYSEGHALVLRERFKVEKSYPLVFANILENILELEYPSIKEAVSPGGHLIVSGLLKGQEENIIAIYNEFSCVKIEQLKDWVAVYFVKEKE